MNKNILSLIENPKQIRGVSANIITGASGGYLFNTLFDGHPEVLPVDLFTPPQKPDFYYYYYIKRFPKDYKKVDFFTECLDAWGIPRFFAQSYKLPHREKHMREAMREGFVNLGEDFSYYHLYYLQYIGIAALCDYPLTTNSPIIIQHQHPHYPHYYKEGYTHLDNSFYLNYFRLIRQPEMSLDRIYSCTKESLFKLPPSMGYGYISPFVLHYQHDLYKYLPKDKLFSIKFEDLHLKTKETLKACCEKMGIQYLPEILLKSTLRGQPFDFFKEPRTGKTIIGFSPARAKSSPRYLSIFYQFFIKYFLEKIYLKYGYKRSPTFAYKILDVFVPLCGITLILPSYRELKIILSFYLYCFSLKKGAVVSLLKEESIWISLKKFNIRTFVKKLGWYFHINNNFHVVYSISNVFTLNRLQNFSFWGLHKSRIEKIYVYFLKPILFFVLMGPIIHFFYIKIKTALFLIHTRFGSAENWPPLINEEEYDEKN